MTLIQAGNSNGVYGRCDAHCHDAKGAKCHCICGGVFHGKGSGSGELYEVVRDCTEALGKKLEADGADVRPLRKIFTCGFPGRQEPLFAEGA